MSNNHELQFEDRRERQSLTCGERTVLSRTSNEAFRCLATASTNFSWYNSLPSEIEQRHRPSGSSSQVVVSYYTLHINYTQLRDICSSKVSETSEQHFVHLLQPNVTTISNNYARKKIKWRLQWDGGSIYLLVHEGIFVGLRQAGPIHKKHTWAATNERPRNPPRYLLYRHCQ